jgi:hypothetical protein
MEHLVESLVGSVGPIAGGILLAIFIYSYYLAQWSGRSLRTQFQCLGRLEGRTKDEIIRVVGQPSGSWTVGEGKTLLQWMTMGYHVALRFDGDRCEGITYEC